MPGLLRFTVVERAFAALSLVAAALSLKGNGVAAPDQVYVAMGRRGSSALVFGVSGEADAVLRHTYR